MRAYVCYMNAFFYTLADDLTDLIRSDVEIYCFAYWRNYWRTICVWFVLTFSTDNGKIHRKNYILFSIYAYLFITLGTICLLISRKINDPSDVDRWKANINDENEIYIHYTNEIWNIIELNRNNRFVFSFILGWIDTLDLWFFAIIRIVDLAKKWTSHTILIYVL